MAGLQRFITYIYYYENEEKKQNTGFAKIEIRGNSCRVEVHIRGLFMDKPECTVYLFTRNDKNMQGIPVGKVNIQRGNGDVGYVFDTRELEHYNISTNELEGIMIPLQKSSYMASQWKEGKILESNFHILEKKHDEKVEETFNTMQEKVPEERQESFEAVEDKEDNIEIEESEIAEENVPQEIPKEEEEENIHTTEIPLEKLFDNVGWERYFMKLKARLPICFPFEGEGVECVQMDIKDIRELPKKYWYLGSNSFLLHGYFNYHHILMGEIPGEMGSEYFLGIPGVYQNQEKMMATMFGFGDFKSKKSSEHKTGEFGYWYRII